MDRSHQLTKVRHVSRKLHSCPVAQLQSRTCLARAQGDRGLSGLMSSWAWPCPLAWNDSSARLWQEPSAHFIKAPPTSQPASAGKREISPDSSKLPNLIANERTCTNGNGTATNATTTGQSQGSRPALGLDKQPRTPPGHLQPHTLGLEKTIVTFAYGANMNFVTLARRGVKVLSRDPAFVVDPAVQLVFKHQGGYATLERVEDGGTSAHEKNEPRFRPYDGRVHGVLYRVTREDFEKLAKREGGYVVQELQVQTYDDSQYNALVFVSNPLFKLPQEVIPTEKYLARVREGARDNYLDPAYQAFLSGINTVPGAGLGSEYYNTPSKYMGYSFLVIAALITLAFFFQH